MESSSDVISDYLAEKWRQEGATEAEIEERLLWYKDLFRSEESKD